MSATIRTAVIACAAQTLAERIARLLALEDVALEALARDANQAADALLRFRPDLLIVDDELPVRRGSDLAAHVSQSFAFPVRPRILLISHGGIHRQTAQGGQKDPLALLITHGGIDFSGAVLQAPFADADFKRAIETLRVAPDRFSEAESRRAEALLDELGVPKHLGRECLKTCALLCAADERLRVNLRAALYPRAGQACGCTAAQAERAMRHAIDLAWQSDKIENQHRIFRDSIDAGRGQPTCREMIFRLADILRLEG